MEQVTPAEVEAFEALCRPTTMDDLGRLRRRVNTHVDRIDEAQLDNEAIDVELARRIARSLQSLAENASTLDARGRSILRGAIDYFLLTDDADDDVTSPVGLLDDARVLNHACRLLGRDDLVLGDS